MNINPYEISEHRWILNDESIQLEMDDFPDQADAVEMMTWWLEKLECDVVEINQGADRAQIQFESDGLIFNFCFDGTCEAIWIESLGQHDAHSLAKLLAK